MRGIKEPASNTSGFGEAKLAYAKALTKRMRRREDSNLRCPFGHTAFRVRPIQPLWHVSKINYYYPNKKSGI